MATYLFTFYCTFLVVLFVMPSYRTYKKTGINPFKFTKDETAINYVGKAYKIISAIAFITITLNAFLPRAMQYLATIEYLKSDIIVWIGFGFLHLAFLVIFIAQRNMANEWRIGIDDENKVNLITKGLFGISRNPIFLGVLIAFVGMFLIIPNAVTFVILISGFIVIQVQVRLEEEFLIKQLGEEYIVYMNNVKRWLI
ncbi:methyltransferase family protein [Flammeovirga kamogawensis]|uniref:Isoprenylcysteine carboxylmethyltransferase family protein n=1 Tax=Flammeovirga kamogawensis TaxID=373891 RepID=A0ABX8H4X4_9BACT|nr:isoprenylcysteine carboxylmethyltransferase family protein [Flammeovirga kamogawensis]MBB6463838.1 protein-S-isoprenylcysteine O-methyltransferase Ste14 [Flammeovirga kamogawensis]QWG10763.1 isoprenylcysteine carboxylmethyltransferase family protein [Flammeovirga kamogawensis]TRX63205.1 isoprenylcysteine carboxylmethyltransferase family protein [Flammeovirga kamogawensis]